MLSDAGSWYPAFLFLMETPRPSPPGETRQATCYLLLGGSDGMLLVTARLAGGVIEALAIEAPSGFGGPVWAALAASFVGLPLVRSELLARIARFQRAGLIPEELDLEPLVTTILKFGP